MNLLEPLCYIEGPAIILNPLSTILINPNWKCYMTKNKNLIINKINQTQNIIGDNSKIECDPI